MTTSSDPTTALPGLLGDRSGNHEIDPGYFHLYQGGSKVGEVYYLGITNVEHWALYPAYVYPSEQHGNEVITFRFIGIPGRTAGVPVTLEDFHRGLPANTTRLRITAERE